MERPAIQRKPYPMPDSLRADWRHANILQGMYSGRDSKLTAVGQYTHHQIELARGHPRIAKTLRGIAVIEMYHLDMLGECIQMLGAQTRFVFQSHGRRSFWHAGFISYGRSVEEMLGADLEGERRSVVQYEEAIRLIDQPPLQKLLERILEDEREHARILESLIQDLGQRNPAPPSA